MSSSVLAVSSPKEARRVQCGFWDNHILVVHPKGGGNKDTLHNDGQQRIEGGR